MITIAIVLALFWQNLMRKDLNEELQKQKQHQPQSIGPVPEVRSPNSITNTFLFRF